MRRMRQQKAQGQWTHIVAAVLVLVVIVVVVLIFTGVLGKARKDISQCKGLLQFGAEAQGSCVREGSCQGTIVSTFGESCQKGEECCIPTSNG
ncbi:hypothetical protein HYS47_03500 [Candidatus Woesearchaeota archaeon]|nr:hypothetical protein [Candidatus Woesearchaeota archaeon]